MFVSYSSRIRSLREEHPEKTAIIFSGAGAEDRVVTWRELDETANAWARNLQAKGVDPETIVVVALPNSLEHAFACIGAWRLGVLVAAVSAKAPSAEKAQVVDAARQGGKKVMLVVETEDSAIACPQVLTSDLAAPADISALPDRTPPGRAVATGGTTGRAKIIVDPNPFGYRGETPLGRAAGRIPGDRILLCGPLYHGGPFMLLYAGLLEDSPVVLMDRFEPQRAQELIRRYAVEWVFFVPTHMKRLIEHETFDPAAFASLKTLYHAAASCPAPLKRRWLDVLGPERVIELYGANDSLGATVIRGDEWLKHPGSVGRPFNSEFAIFDEDGRKLPPGEIGLIYMRSLKPMFGGDTTKDPRSIYYYLGYDRPMHNIDGFETVGDLGYLDEEGYLYLADRRVDMIISGGANIYPAEVEAVLTEHPAVADAAVIGISDPDWGRRVHAIVELKPGRMIAESELASLVRERLAPYKAPKSYEFVDVLDRNEAGKLQRHKMVKDREKE